MIIKHYEEVNMKTSREQINKLILKILIIVAMTATVFLATFFINVYYTTLQNIFSRAMLCSFALVLLLLRKPQIFHYSNLIYSVLCFGFGLWYILERQFGVHIVWGNSLLVGMIWLYGLFIIDLIRNRNLKSLRELNWKLLAVFALMALAMNYCRNERNMQLILLFPFGFFYLMRLTKDDWDNLIQGLQCGFFLAFAWVMIKSLANVPYTGSRYYGWFINIGEFGIFLSCAFVMAIFTIYQAKEKYGRKNVLYIGGWLWLFCVSASLLMVSTRTAYVTIVALILLIVMPGIVKWYLKKDTLGKVSCWVALAILIALLAGGIMLIMNTDNDVLMKLTSNSFINGKIMRIKEVIYYSIKPETFASTTCFENNRILNVIDKFTSGRVSIAYTYLQEMDMLGHSISSLMVGVYPAMNTHCTYVQMPYDYGILSGILFFVWLVVLLFTSMKREYRLNNRIVTLWIVMAFFVNLGETEWWAYPPLFFLLLIQYPIISGISKAEE